MPGQPAGAPKEKLSKEDVVLAFKLILGRLPENDNVIASHQLGSLDELRIVLLRSAEFAKKYQALLDRLAAKQQK
jgi:hypothetical protein